MSERDYSKQVAKRQRIRNTTRNQELRRLLRGSVAGRIAGLFLRDAESLESLPDLGVIVD